MTSKTPEISPTTVLISDGINAIMSLVCADKCNDGESLTDDEKGKLNEIISTKVKGEVDGLISISVSFFVFLFLKAQYSSKYSRKGYYYTS